MSKKAEIREKREQERIEKMRNRALISGKVDLTTLPEPIRIDDGRKCVRVFVEGYEDVALLSQLLM